MKRTTTSTTGIEWTDHTWNPFVGCSILSAGCTNCYAMRQAHKLESFGVPQYQGVTRIANGNPVWTGKLHLSSDAAIRKPLGIKRPSFIFVNSMSDFFHDAAADSWREKAIMIMQQTPRHEYQVLTKRPENIMPFLERRGSPFPRNMWVGATVERANVARRIDLIRAIKASIKFLSIEPLIGQLGPVDFSGIDWIIIGGESGPGARPMKYEWVTECIEQANRDRVPIFFKQWGRSENNPLWHTSKNGNPTRWVSMHDPVGKGGSKVNGTEYKHFPRLPGS